MSSVVICAQNQTPHYNKIATFPSVAWGSVLGPILYTMYGMYVAPVSRLTAVMEFNIISTLYLTVKQC